MIYTNLDNLHRYQGLCPALDLITTEGLMAKLWADFEDAKKKA